jgi:hypothetical protein
MRRRDNDARNTALGVGGATLAGLVGYDALQKIRLEQVEDKVRATRAAEDFFAKLQPGDVIFSRTARDKGDKGIPLVQKFMNEILGAAKGDSYPHGMIYTGRKNVVEALDTNGVKGSKASGYYGALKAYRPNVSDREREHAVAYARKQIGKRYATEPEYFKHGLSHMFNITNGPKTGTACEGHTCTSLVGDAYSKRVKQRYMSPDQIKAAADMELVAKYSPSFHSKVPLHEHMLTKGLYPTLRNLKYGIGAGLGAYALSRLTDSKENMA